MQNLTKHKLQKVAKLKLTKTSATCSRMIRVFEDFNLDFKG
jgi:hypothetical protein